MNELHQHGPEDILIAVAGNKADLEDKRVRALVHRVVDSSAAVHDVNSVLRCFKLRKP